MPNTTWKVFYRAASSIGYDLGLAADWERTAIREMIIEQYRLNPRENPLRGLHLNGKEGEVFDSNFFRDTQKVATVKSELEALATQATQGRERIGYDVFHYQPSITQLMARRMLNPDPVSGGTAGFIDPSGYDRLIVRFWKKVE